MPKAFFDVGRPIAIAESGAAHMRSLRSTTLSERRRALGHASLAWELVALLENYLTLPEVDLPHAVLPDAAGNADIEALASEARSWFGIPAGQPVPNVVRLLESRGVVVVRLPVESEQVDAFCVQLEGRPVVVLSSDKDDKARSRFDAAHELGHLIAHHDVEPGTHTVERQANGFGAAFLMPADAIRPMLPGRLDWAKYIELKRHWGVSLSSLIFRAKTLGVISDDTYRRAFTTMNTRTNSDGVSWRKREPGELGQPEEPQLLRKAVDMLSESGITTETLANRLGIPTSQLGSLLGAQSKPSIELLT